MESHESSAKVLSDLLKGPNLVVAPSCYDPLTAKLIEELKFPACSLGGYALGASRCVAEPMLTLTEMVTASADICAAVKIPMIVDAGTGFGGPANIYRGVKEFSRVGVAAIHIEDQVYPKHVGYHKGRTEIVSKEMMIERLHAAFEGRKDRDLLIIARTDARGAINGGYEEALERVRVYAEVGADMIMVFPRTENEAATFAKLISTPLVYALPEGRTSRPDLSLDRIQELGYRLVIPSEACILLSYRYIKDAYRRLKETGTLGMDPTENSQTRVEIETTLGIDLFYSLERRCLERR
jgi:methylisocitrate lyase